MLVAGADEGAALQAGPGDWLLLKGHLAPGNYGGWGRRCWGWLRVCVVAG